jgi:hypothetical protein
MSASSSWDSRLEIHDYVCFIDYVLIHYIAFNVRILIVGFKVGILCTILLIIWDNVTFNVCVLIEGLKVGNICIILLIIWDNVPFNVWLQIL